MKGVLDVAPDLELLGLGARQHHAAVLAVGPVEVDVDVVPGPHIDVAVAIEELVNRDLALGLEADVHGDEVTGHEDHTAADDFTRADGSHALFEERAEIIFARCGSVSWLFHVRCTPWG